jgi:hypothetical protein
MIFLATIRFAKAAGTVFSSFLRASPWSGINTHPKTYLLKTEIRIKIARATANTGNHPPYIIKCKITLNHSHFPFFSSGIVVSFSLLIIASITSSLPRFKASKKIDDSVYIRVKYYGEDLANFKLFYAPDVPYWFLSNSLQK